MLPLLILQALAQMKPPQRGLPWPRKLMLPLSVTLSCLFPSGDTSHHHLKLFICQSSDFPPRTTSWAQGLTVLSTDVRRAWRNAHFWDDQGQGPWEAWRTPALPHQGPCRGLAWRRSESHTGTEPQPLCQHHHPRCRRRRVGALPVRGTLFPAGAAHRGVESMRRPPLGFSPSVPQAPGALPPNRSLVGPWAHKV